MGASCLPTLRLSSQPEDLVMWLLEAQNIMTTLGHPANDADAPCVPPELDGPPTEEEQWKERGMSAHEEAMAGAIAAARRNNGSFSFGSGGLTDPPPSRSGRGAAG